MNIKELGDEIVAAVRSHVAAALQPLASRLSALEVRSGGLAMMLARADRDREALAQFEAHIARVNELERRILSIEQQLKR